MKELTKDNLKEIINKQFEMNGYDLTFENVEGIDDWFTKYTTTKEKEEEFRQWLIKYLKKYTIKYRLEKEAGRFILLYGLKTIGNK